MGAIGVTVHIDLGRDIQGKVLEGILIDSAQDLTLKTHIRDTFREKYVLTNDEENPVERKKIYNGSKLSLWDKQIEKGTIFFNREEPNNSILFIAENSYETPEDVEDYLTPYLAALVKNIKKIN